MTSEHHPRAAFICGCGHSGTTLVATMLANHAQIFAPLVETGIFLRDDREMTRETLVDLRRQTRDAGKTLLVEKTPSHVRHLNRLRAFEPKARLILMVRDGRDVAASIGNRKAGDYQAGVNRWIGDNRRLLAEASNPLAYLLRYEDLIENPEREMRGVCAFLGVPYDPAMLNYHERENLWYGKNDVRKTSGVGSEHEDLRNWQVNQPIFDGRANWKSRLPPEYAAQFGREPALTIMRKLRYGAEGSEGHLSGPIRRVTGGRIALYLRNRLRKLTQRRPLAAH